MLLTHSSMSGPIHIDICIHMTKDQRRECLDNKPQRYVRHVVYKNVETIKSDIFAIYSLIGAPFLMEVSLRK